MNIPDFDRKKQYYRAFWEREVLDRPLVNVKAPTGPHLPAAYLEGAETGAYLPVLEKAAANFRNTWFGGEALPYFECSLGPDQFAAFLGGEIEFSQREKTSWVKPFWGDDYSEADVTIDTAQGSYFDRLMTFIKTAADTAEREDAKGNGFLVSMPDLHSNMDAIMAARGSENLCLDLADDPGRVERVLQKLLPLFPFAVDSAAKAGNMEKNGYIGWIPTYSEGKFATIQCDFSIMISPRMCRRFVVPALEYEASCLERCIYHYDGPGALSHLDEILGIKKIGAIQWVPGDGQPRSIEWMDLLKKIQKAGKGLWIYDWTVQEIKDNFKELDPRGLLFEAWAQTPAEGEELLEYLKRRM